MTWASTSPGGAANPEPVVLCLGGWDPSCGAGLGMDLRVLDRLGCHPLAVPTTLVVENTVDVAYGRPVDPALLADSIDRLLEDFDPAAVKIGLVGSEPQWLTLLALRRRFPAIPFVVDPVWHSSAGEPLSEAMRAGAVGVEWVRAMSHSTPNARELACLVGEPEGERPESEWIAMARRVIGGGDHTVVLTGGHHRGVLRHVDLLITRDHAQRISPVVPPRHADRDYHGTGCLQAAALAAHLARGFSTEAAVMAAKGWTTEQLNAQPERTAARSGRLIRLG